MKKWFLHIWACLLLLVGVACTDDAEPMQTDYGKKVRLELQLAMPAGNALSRVAAYEDGQILENYIDFFDENKYRIYFFNSENRYIARFIPSEVMMGLGNQYLLYNLEGDVPEALIPQSGTTDFKIVVLGNWPDYDDSALIPGTTTIDDVCHAEWATFEYWSDFELDRFSGKLIPFYGVHAYTGIEFKSDEVVTLSDPVTMLRAMAKVEVTIPDGGLDFESVSICRYNSEGYCAPSGVHSQADYGQSNPSDPDYLTSLHLVDNANETDEKELALQETKVNGKETWIAYLPEYQNKGVENNFSYIKVKLTEEEEIRTIYFAEYTNGQTSNADEIRMDIKRNNIYRFAVHASPLLFAVSVDQWEWGGKVHIDM